MILRMLRLVLLGGLAAAVLVPLAGHLSAPPPRAAQAAPARPDARPALPRTSPMPAASPVDTPFGDASFRAWCTWTLLRRLSDRPEWTLRRAAELCLCIADRVREGRLTDLPDVNRADIADAAGTIEERLCRGR